MAGRPAKKVRRLSTDSEGDEDGYGVDLLGLKAPGKSQTGRASASKAVGKNSPTRSRRSTNVVPEPSSATISRGSASRMKLTVKTSSSKLREATRLSSGSGKAVINVNSREQFVGGEILEGKRARNVKRSYVLESEEEDEEDEDEEMEDVDAEGEDEDAEAEEDDEEMDDGLGDEDAEGEEDVEMDIPPPPPVIKISKARHTITAKPQSRGNLMSVEQKEMQDAEGSDEELSDLDSLEGVEEEEEAMQTGNEEDAEGEEEEIEVEDEVDEDDEELDSDDETPGGGSRASTPDLNKLTKRQRARLEEGGSGHLLALPDEVQVKKHLTAEEHAMRRAEMARRRKNLSEKRNEEEKMETINKLLKKQAPKTNARRNILNNVAGDATPNEEMQKPNPLFVRWVSNKDGNRIGVPEEWLDAPAGKLFQGSVRAAGLRGKLIQEVS